MAEFSQMACSKRRPNFLECEKEALVTAVRQRHKVISDAFSAIVSKETKKKAWKEILICVNQVSPYQRKLGEIKKKYQCLKSNVKNVASENRREILKTGGGTSKLKKLTSTEQELLETISVTCLEGISEGIELYDHLGNPKRLPQDPLSSSRDAEISVDLTQDACNDHNESFPFYNDHSMDDDFDNDLLHSEVHIVNTTKEVLNSHNGQEDNNEGIHAESSVVPQLHQRTKPKDSREIIGESLTHFSSSSPVAVQTNGATDKGARENEITAGSKIVHRHKGNLTKHTLSNSQLLEKQVALFKTQIILMERIANSLEERNTIQKEILEVKRRKLYLLECRS